MSDSSRDEPEAPNYKALALYGVFLFFAFPHEIPFAAEAGASLSSIDLGLALTWLVPAALVVGLDGLSPRRAAKVAFLASFVAHAVFFYWFMVVTVVYGGMPFVLGVLAPLVPALYVAPFTALFAWGFARFGSTALPGVLFGAALWVCADWARGHLLGGFPWATLGYGLHLDLPLLAYTRWGGVYLLSFFAAGVGLWLGQIWLARSDAMGSSARALLAVGGALAGLHAGGLILNALEERRDASETVSIRVAAIQGNIQQGQKWEARRREQILSTYLRLSEAAADSTGEGVDWIVWPETAVPGIIENDSILRTRLAELARSRQASLVVGGMGVEIDHEARIFSAFYDSAFQFDPDGALNDRYDKTHLVPFGEFVPLRGLLGSVFQSLATGLSSSDVTPGERPRNMMIVPSAREAERVLVGVPICYELLFPDLVRRFGGEGATALLAITNDAWYGRTGAPHQFLAMTAMRAAENALPTVRAANTGVSALIDDRGRVIRRSGLFEEAFVVGEIQLQTGREPTFYARFGDAFVMICLLGTFVWGVRAALDSKRRSAEDATAA